MIGKDITPHTLLSCLEEVVPQDMAARKAAQDQWNSIAKPVGSLGLLEDAIIQIAGITRTPQVDISVRKVLAFCGDNGVVEEGVTQTGQEVTALVAINMAHNRSSVCQMARVAQAQVVPVDIGIATPVEGVINCNIMRGTHNMTCGRAMSYADALNAVCVGINQVGRLAREGTKIIVTAEMGIGNTTAASALVAALLDVNPCEVTGRGAGLSSEGLKKKIAAIERALEVNKPKADDPIDVLSCVGALEIAGMVGTFLGGALYHIPIVIDGFISMTAALLAQRLCPTSREYMLASHASAEPAVELLIHELNLNPLIYAQMRLGEGTGGVCLLPLLDMALALYQGTTFSQTGMDAYDTELS